MELFTENQLKRLQDNGQETRFAQDMETVEPDHFPVVRLFLPATGMTWLLTEMDPECPSSIAFGLCDLGMGSPELGSVSICEIESVLPRFGVGVERDGQWEATHPISVYAEAARAAGRIVTDRASLDAATKVEA